jgi:hypothetical protein
MQKDNQAHKQEDESVPDQPELSPIWQELLGGRPLVGQDPSLPGDVGIPTLESDPWSSLLQATGVEIVDLQMKRLQMSDQEVEQMLQVMQEQPTQEKGDDPSARR